MAVNGAAARTTSEILTGIEDAVAVDRPRPNIRLTDSIRENLRLDSLALLEVLTRIEEQFGINLIDDPQIYSVTTVEELVGLIQAALRGEDQPAAPTSAG